GGGGAGGAAVAGAPAGAPPVGARAGAPAPQAVVPDPVAPQPVAPQQVAPQPGPIEFNAHAAHGHGRNTVQFLPAVQPSPGSPLFGQVPRPPEEVAQSVVEQP